MERETGKDKIIVQLRKEIGVLERLVIKLYKKIENLESELTN